MINRFFKENTLLAVLVFSNQVFWFFFKLILLWQLSDEDYSFFIVSVATLMTLQFIGHLNLFKSMSITISKGENKDSALLENQEVINSHFTTVAIFSVLASVILSIMIYLNSNNLLISILFGLNLIFENTILFFYFIFIGLNLVKKAGLAFISSNLVRLSLITTITLIGFSVANTTNVGLIIGIYTFSTFVSVLICYFLSLNHFKRIIIPQNFERYKIASSLVIIREGIFLTLISIIIQTYSTIVYMFIKYFDINSIKESDVSLMLVSFLLIFYSLTSLLTSVNPEMLRELNYFLKKFFSPLTISAFIITGLIFVIISIESPFTPLFELLCLGIFNLEYRELIPILKIAILGVPFHTIYMMIMGYFVGRNQSKLQFLFNLSAFLISLPILFILSYNFGADGSILSYTIFSVLLASFSILGILCQYINEDMKSEGSIAAFESISVLFLR
ncbi:MAG: hypothetical protein ACW98F_00450 [Candidatus Hodarchaeales archaeon]|jgi:O-antigen/teichoic acid export membrane protein